MNHLDESVNVPIVDTEVKAVLVLFISILTKENLWTEHDRKFNKWNGELFSKVSVFYRTLSTNLLILTFQYLDKSEVYDTKKVR